jgi:hypothetical protein
MKLAAAVDIYVLHRQAMGQKWEGPEAALRAFSRRSSSRPLQRITSSDVKRFLDVPQTGPAAWRRKYGVFPATPSRGGEGAAPIPRIAPESWPEATFRFQSPTNRNLVVDRHKAA